MYLKIVSTEANNSIPGFWEIRAMKPSGSVSLSQVGYLINKKVLMTTSNVFCLEYIFSYIILWYGMVIFYLR